MEVGKASTNFHRSESTSTNFHFTSVLVKASMEVSLLPVNFQLLPWELVEISMEVDRMEFGGLLWNVYGSSSNFVILVEVGGSM